MAGKGKSSQFMTYKDRKGGVSIVRRGGKYDEGYGNDTIDGISGYAKADVIGDKKGNKKEIEATAKQFRESAAQNRQKNARDQQSKDFKFFKHTTKGK